MNYLLTMLTIMSILCSCDTKINMTEGDKYCDHFMVYQVFGESDRSCVIVDSATMVSSTEATAWLDGREMKLIAPEIRIHRQPCY